MSAVETARLLLRRWQDDDLELLVALYGDPRVASAWSGSSARLGPTTPRPGG